MSALPAPATATAVLEPKTPQQKKVSVQKRLELVGSNTVKPDFGKRIQPLTREQRASALDAILGSRNMISTIHKPNDTDLTRKLADVKHTGFSSYKASMGYTI